MAKLTKPQQQRQDHLAREATKANQRLGELRAKHNIADDDWAEIAEHHNGIIALAQEAIVGKAEGKGQKAK